MQGLTALLLGASVAVVAATTVNSATPTITPSASTPTSGPCASTCSLAPSTRILANYHCQDPGTVSTPKLIRSFQSSSGDYTSCYTSCWSIDTCVSFSFDSTSQSCELYSKTVTKQGFTSLSASTQLFWNIRGCFAMPQIVCSDSSSGSTSSSASSSTPSSTPTPSLTCAGAIDFPSDLTVPFLIQWAINSASQPIYLLLGLGTVQYNVPSYGVSTTSKYTSGSTAAVYTMDSSTGYISNSIMNADFTTSAYNINNDETRLQFQSQRYYGTLDSSKILSWSYNNANGLLSLGGTGNQQYMPIYCETPAVLGQDINIIKTGTTIPAGCVVACPAAVVPAAPSFGRRNDGHWLA